ncbi:MAG: type II secretion system F family protein [Patescibacteria group bacterium]|nr:type II secretion system F family protein [Patescibacteria group bacterium]
MKFRLTAVTKDGDTYNEELDVSDRFAAYRDIRARGDRVISLSEERQGRFSFSILTNAFGSVKLDEKVVVARNLAAMLEAGLTTSRALSVMERQSKNPRMKAILNSIIADVKKGNTFSGALSKFERVFSPLFVSMARAGEESGKLSESLRVVAVQMERASNLTKKVKGALIYPSIVVCAMVVIGVLMLIYVVPTLSQTFAEVHAQLPPTTTFIITASKFLTTHTWQVVLGAFILVFLFIAGLRTAPGARFVDWVLLHMPIIGGLIRETNAARTTRTLASLLSAGVDVIYSLTITRDVVGNHYFKNVLSEAEAAVTKGAPISEAFAKHPNLYPPLVAEMIAVGEETGRVAELLKETAEFYEESVERQTKDLSTIIEPFLMLVIGAAVGFFAISMIAPIYSLSNAIG